MRSLTPAHLCSCRRLLPRLCVLSAFAALLGALTAAEPSDVTTLLHDSGRSGGLAVHVACSDGQLEAAIASNGRWLVQGLTTSASTAQTARQLLAQQGRLGIAQIQHLPSLKQLPYQANTINLLIIDQDALGADGPDQAELERVLAPGFGAAYRRVNGNWSWLRPKLPDTMDSWSQPWYDASRNPVSHDTAIKPPNGLHWIAGVMTQSTTANGPRIDAGRLFYSWKGNGDFNPWSGDVRSQIYPLSRDAFSGVALWHQAPNEGLATSYTKLNPLVFADNRIWTYDGKKDRLLVCYDATTGQELRRYPELGPYDEGLSTKYNSAERRMGDLIWHQGELIWANRQQLIAFDPDTAAFRLNITVPDCAFIEYPTLAAEHDLVIVAVAEEDKRLLGRNPNFPTARIEAYDLKTGRQRWKFDFASIADSPWPEEGSGQRWLSQIFYCDDQLFFYRAGGAGSLKVKRPSGGTSDTFCIGALNALNGQFQWLKEDLKNADWIGEGSQMEAMAHHGRVYMMGHGLKVFDAATGALQHSTFFGNSRCDRSVATANLVTLSFGNYVDISQPDAMRWFRNDLARSACATGAIPAYGMMYFMPTRCGCFDSVRSFLSLAHEPVLEPVADSERLEVFQQDQLTKPEAWPPAHSWGHFLADAERSGASAATIPWQLENVWTNSCATVVATQTGPVRNDWEMTSRWNGPVTAPTVVGDLLCAAEREAGRVFAFDAHSGEPRWSTILPARVDQPPTIYGSVVLAGCRDGYVYCLDAQTGAQRWRLLIARTRQQLVADSQLESIWPLNGSITIVDGIAFASAGYHPDANGGIEAISFDPISGHIHWRRNLNWERKWYDIDDFKLSRKEAVPFAQENGGYLINRLTNTLPYYSEGFALDGWRFDPATGERATTPSTFSLNYGQRPPERDPWHEDYSGPGQSLGRGQYRKGNLSIGYFALASNQEQVLAVWQTGWNSDTWKFLRWELDAVTADFKDKNADKLAQCEYTLSDRGSLRLDDIMQVAVTSDKALMLTRLIPSRNQPEFTGHLLMWDLTAGGNEQVDITLPARPIRNGMAIANGSIYITLFDGRIVALRESSGPDPLQDARSVRLNNLDDYLWRIIEPQGALRARALPAETSSQTMRVERGRTLRVRPELPAGGG